MLVLRLYLSLGRLFYEHAVFYDWCCALGPGVGLINDGTLINRFILLHGDGYPQEFSDVVTLVFPSILKK